MSGQRQTVLRAGAGRRMRRADLAAIFALPALVALLAHGAILVNEFVWDDDTLIVKNARLSEPGALGQAWIRDYGLEFGDRRLTGYYRPLFMAALVVQRAVFGVRPAGYRMASLVTLVAAAWIVSASLRYFGGRGERARGAAAFGGCLVAAHPLLTEPVAIVASWPDLFLAVALGGAAALGLAATRPGATGPRVTLAAASAVLAMAAMLVKDTGALGAAGALAGFLAVGWRGRRGALAVGAGWLAAFAAYFWIRSHAALGGPDSALIALLRPFHREGAASALAAALRAARVLFVPTPTPYERYLGLTAADGAVPPWAVAAQAAMVLLVVAALVVFATLVRQRRPLVAVLAGWALGQSWSLPVACALGLPYSDRYVAAAPLLALAALGAGRAARSLGRFPAVRGSRGIAPAAVAAWLYVGLCVAVTLDGGTKAMNSKTFFLSAARERLPSPYGHLSMATYHLLQGDFEKMEREARLAIAGAPDNGAVRELGSSLGLKAMLEGDFARALEWYDWTLEKRAGHRDARKGRVACLLALGRWREARESAAAARGLWPDDAGFAFVEARAWALSPDAPPEAAAERARRLRAVAPEVPEAWLTSEGVRAARAGSSGPRAEPRSP